MHSLFLLLLAGAPILVQPTGSEDLSATIRLLDQQLFDAYNRCDLNTLGTLVADDLEFYHDKTGLSKGKEPFLAAIRQNICGKVTRTLVPGSLEVYPLKGYGAVELGVHRFHHPAHPEEGIGEGKFVILWHNRNGAWKLTRTISYDHKSVPK